MLEPNSHVGQNKTTLCNLVTVKIAIRGGPGVLTECRSFDCCCLKKKKSSQEMWQNGWCLNVVVLLKMHVSMILRLLLIQAIDFFILNGIFQWLSWSTSSYLFSIFTLKQHYFLSHVNYIQRQRRIYLQNTRCSWVFECKIVCSLSSCIIKNTFLSGY